MKILTNESSEPNSLVLMGPGMAVHGDEVALVCEPSATSSFARSRRHREFLPLASVSAVVLCLLLVVPVLFYGRSLLVSMM